MPVLAVEGADIYYEVHGKGPPMLLLSGTACDGGFLDATSGSRVLARSHGDHLRSARHGQNRHP